MTGPPVDLSPDRVATLAERSYVGAVLHLRGQQARDALARVSPADLSDPQLRAVLEAVSAVLQDGSDPDPALLTPRMLELGLVPRDKAGLVNAMIVDLYTDVPAPVCWPAYATEVLRESARRKIRETAERMVQAADGPDLASAVRVMHAGLGDVAVLVQRAVEAAG